MGNPNPPKSLASAASGWLEPSAVKMAAEHAQLRLRVSMAYGETNGQKSFHQQQPRPPSGYRPHTTNRSIKGRGGRVVKGTWVGVTGLCGVRPYLSPLLLNAYTLRSYTS